MEVGRLEQLEDNQTWHAFGWDKVCFAVGKSHSQHTPVLKEQWLMDVAAKINDIHVQLYWYSMIYPHYSFFSLACAM